MRPTQRAHARIFGILTVAIVGFSLANVASADERRGASKYRNDRVEHYDHRAYTKHDRHHPSSHRDRHAHDRHHYRPKHEHHHARSGWHYHAGRYWAPPSYRGRYCSDRRHYHGVHYHVAYQDYYDYYYPRYRYYGPHVHGASLIIAVPLF